MLAIAAPPGPGAESVGQRQVGGAEARHLGGGSLAAAAGPPPARLGVAEADPLALPLPGGVEERRPENAQTLRQLAPASSAAES